MKNPKRYVPPQIQAREKTRRRLPAPPVNIPPGPVLEELVASYLNRGRKRGEPQAPLRTFLLKARLTGGHFYAIVAATRNPSPEMVERLADTLGVPEAAVLSAIHRTQARARAQETLK
jgi:hypothetical protein